MIYSENGLTDGPLTGKPEPVSGGTLEKLGEMVAASPNDEKFERMRRVAASLRRPAGEAALSDGRTFTERREQSRAAGGDQFPQAHAVEADPADIAEGGPNTTDSPESTEN